jgi:hypothetical protein
MRRIITWDVTALPLKRKARPEIVMDAKKMSEG